MTENHNEDSQANFLGSRWRAKKAAIQNQASGSFAGVYELLDQIDEDKMFVIFKARHPQNQKHAKIKLLKAEYLADKIAIMSVYKEAKEAALANSGFQDFGMTNSGCPYLVYKWDHEKE